MKKKIIIFLILVGGIFLVTGGFSLAKYASSSVWNYYLESHDFAFSSDKLGDKLVRNVDNLWTGESVYFTLMNSLNNSEGTEFDIHYTATCTTDNGASCYLNGTNSDVYNGILSTDSYCVNHTDDGVDVSELDRITCQTKGYEWQTAPTKANLYFDVDTTDLTDVVVTITVTSTEPYKKTLVGEFALHKDENQVGEIALDYKSNVVHDTLVISNSYDEDKCVSVNWNASDLRIDSSNFLSTTSNSEGYINQILLRVKPKSTMSYPFYCINADHEYGISDFNWSEVECFN